MSEKENQKLEQRPENNEYEEQQQKEEDPNALTEEDKQVYKQIMASITRMSSKIKTAKDKVPQEEKEAHKRTQVNEIAQKLIESKEQSDIVNKEDLLKDVHQSFEEMVVQVYSQNEQLKKKINSLVAIIKQQNHKINHYREREEKLKEQNEKMQQEMMRMKDQNLINPQAQKSLAMNTKPGRQQGQRSRVITDNQSEDYDFWTMPQNDGSGKKRKQFVAESGLWVNQKQINQSVFITDQGSRKR